MTTSLFRLNGKSVALRDFKLADEAAFAEIVGDDRVTTWLSFDSRSRDVAAHMLAGIIDRAKSPERTEYYFAVTDPCNDAQLIGFARLGLSGVRAGKVGYAIHADFWGRGYATDALWTLAGFAYTRLNLHRLTAAIGPENFASIAVVKKLGFTREGRLRDHVWTNGAWRDSELYSLLEPEYRAVLLESR